MELIYIIVALVSFAAISFFLFKYFQKKSHLEFSSIAQDALKNVTGHFMEIAKAHLSTEGEKVSGEFKKEREGVEQIVKGLKEQLGKYEQLVRDFEKDRDMKYSSLEEQIKGAAKATETLQSTTSKLSNMLSNVKTRGQWGEKMAEDILNYSGLQKGLHYEKNSSFETTTDRPDYIFLLPGNHKLAMDVKFPFNNYLKYMDASSDAERTQRQKEFLTDVKARINEISKRDYMPSFEGTLDYVILFIPNEQVYSFVNETYSDLIEESLRKKIILCSPWTLYAVLRIIWQAWQNYHYSQGIRDVVHQVNDFLKEFEKFKEKMDNLGQNLNRTQKAYDDLAGARQRQLDRRIDKIKDYGIGQGFIENEYNDEHALPQPQRIDNEIS